jgi:deoxyadenosine/deoxycytidine kinase
MDELHSYTYFKIERDQDGYFVLYKRPWRGSHRWEVMERSTTKNPLYIVMECEAEKIEERLTESGREFYDITGKRVWI